MDCGILACLGGLGTSGRAPSASFGCLCVDQNDGGVRPGALKGASRAPVRGVEGRAHAGSPDDEAVFPTDRPDQRARAAHVRQHRKYKERASGSCATVRSRASLPSGSRSTRTLVVVQGDGRPDPRNRFVASAADVMLRTTAGLFPVTAYDGAVGTDGTMEIHSTVSTPYYRHVVGTDPFPDS